jgi:hypothetical protein
MSGAVSAPGWDPVARAGADQHAAAPTTSLLRVEAEADLPGQR